MGMSMVGGLWTLLSCVVCDGCSTRSPGGSVLGFNVSARWPMSSVELLALQHSIGCSSPRSRDEGVPGTVFELSRRRARGSRRSLEISISSMTLAVRAGGATTLLILDYGNPFYGGGGQLSKA